MLRTVSEKGEEQKASVTDQKISISVSYCTHPLWVHGPYTFGFELAKLGLEPYSDIEKIAFDIISDSDLYISVTWNKSKPILNPFDFDQAINLQAPEYKETTASFATRIVDEGFNHSEVPPVVFVDFVKQRCDSIRKDQEKRFNHIVSVISTIGLFGGTTPLSAIVAEYATLPLKQRKIS